MQNYWYVRIQVSLVIFFLLFFINCSAETIKISAIDWCPQICTDPEKPGYAIELVEKIYKDSKYQLDIQIYPWSRAIKNVRDGNADALLSPAKAEAPDLLFPKYGVGKQRMCFFTSKDSVWQYKGPDSLNNLQIGIATDTSIEELNGYLKTHPEQFQFQPYHERYVIQNAHKLNKHRIDTFLFTENTTRYILAQADVWEKYRKAGCVSEAIIYMAFTPVDTSQQRVREMMEFFDARMKKINKTLYFSDLLDKYGLE